MTEVSLGRRKIATKRDNGRLEELLEKGRKLRKSNAYPIECQVKINRVWKAHKSNIERNRSKRQKMLQEGTLPPSVSIEPSHYNEHWQTYPAIIPAGGISKAGYVTEVWIRTFRGTTIEINNRSYEVINPLAHDTEHWIQGFVLNSDGLMKLLPSPKIVVKYFRELE